MDPGAADAGNTLRVLDTGAATPTWNMAFDAELLRRDGPPTLRFYTWSPPGLSIGWFQDVTDFAAVPGEHWIVRRPTGGGAIYHGDELTFALTVSAAALPGDVPSSYRRLHAAVARALASVGVETRMVGADEGPSQHARPVAPWCFAVPGALDLVLAADGRKIVGSAQRRAHGRVLHHGSIVLTAPAATPFCGAVADRTDPRAVESRLRAALAHEITAELGFAGWSEAAPEAGELTAAATMAAGMPRLTP